MPVASQTPERSSGHAPAPQGRELGRQPWWRRWGECLFAVLGGNVIYLLVEPELPETLRHQIFRVDWGLGLDFAICAALYGVIRAIQAH